VRRLACACWVTALLGACSVYETPAGSGGATASTGGASGAARDGGSGGMGGAGGTESADGGDDASNDADDGGATGGSAGSGGGAGTSGAGGTAGGGGGHGGAGGAPDAAIDISMGGTAGARDAATDPTPEVIAPPDGPGCAGYALEFNGFGYVSVNRPVQDDFTLEAWIKTTASPTGTTYPEGNGVFYADKGMSGNDFGSSVLNGKFAFGVGNGATSNAMTTLLSTTTVTTGQWVHVAATRKMSTGEIQVFVNGVMEGRNVVATQKNSLNAQPVMTIAGNTVDFHYFVGQIDEVRVWNVVRTSSDITTAMHTKLTGTEPGLVGYWRFDEGSGAVATDGTSSKNNGAVSGFAMWVASDAPVCP
jgi:hypothetical protein